MVAKVGREFLIKTSSSTVICTGIRNKTVGITNSRVDITSDDDSGWLTALATPGEKGVSISFDGITKDATLRAVVMSGTNCMLEDVIIEYIDGATETGDFFIESIEYTGPYNDAVTFTATLSSSGAVVETAGGA
jgi:TP901-1 family phage major tail protein